MTFDSLLSISAESLAAMSDEELTAFLTPYFPAARTPSEEKQTAKAVQSVQQQNDLFARLMAMAK